MRSLIRPLMTIHRWTGLLVGIAVVWLALSGAAIVFRPSLDAAVYPQLATIRPCLNPRSLDELLQTAERAYTSSKVTYLYLYGRRDASVMIRFADAQQMYVNECTGRVLGVQPRYGGWLGTLEGLHKARFLKAAAMPVIGTTSLILAVLLVGGGLTIWWPRRRASSIPKLHLRGRARSVNLHVAIGLYASAIVFVVALTALPLSLGWAREALFHFTSSTDKTDDGPMPVLVHIAAAQPRITIQQAWEVGRTIFPGTLWWGSIQLPKRGEPLEVGIVLANAPHGEARNYVYLDPSGGRIVSVRPYSTLNLGSKAYYWALAIHTGRAGGFAVRVAMLVAMIALAFVTYAGFDSFLRSLSRRKPRARA